MSGTTAYGYLAASAAASDQALRVDSEIVMGNFFEVLGVKPHRGRLIEPTDDLPSADPVAVVSFDLWQRLFEGKDTAIGRQLRVNGQIFTIAGVAQRGFRGADAMGHVDIWVPMTTAAQLAPNARRLHARDVWWLKGVGRLAPGISLGQASAALQTRATTIAQSFSDSHDGFSVQVVPLRGSPPGDREEMPAVSAMLLGVTMTVLVIACANVANLVLVRGVAKGPQNAIRLALGASRARLLRQELLESALLAVAGGAVALLVSLWTSPLLRRFAGSPIDADFTADQRVLLFTLGASTLTVLVCGLAPALRAASVAPGRVLKTEHGSADARPRSRLQRALVSGQLALSLVLLVAAALFLKSLVVARNVDVGFNPRGRVALEFNLRMHGYSAARAQAFYRALLDRVRASPSVRAASLAHFILEQHIGERLEAERKLSRVLGVFGLVALALASIGLYSLVAYTVVARTREIGIRVALGARAGDVLRLFVTDAARLMLAGFAVGLPITLGVTVLLARSFFGIQVADPIAIGAVALVLAVVVLVASYFPARRALRVDAAVALRAE